MTRAHRSGLLSRMIPVLVLLLGAVLTLGLWKVMSGNEVQRVQLETQVTAEQVKLRLEAWFDTRGAVVTLFAEEWAQILEDGQGDFSSRAGRVLQLYPGFQALNFIDEDWVIRQVVPLEANRAALGKDLHVHPAPAVREALTLADETGTIHRTSLIQLLQGEPGFATYVPVILADGRQAGFINGVFGVDELVNSCLSEDNLRERFHFRLVTLDGREAFRHGQSDLAGAGRPGPTVTLPVRIVDRQWNLEIGLSPVGMAAAGTSADELLALVGFSLSLLLAILLRAYQVRRRELDAGREEYRLLVENQADFMVKVTESGEITFASPSFSRFLDQPEAGLVGRPFGGLVAEDDRPAFASALEDILTPPHRVEVEFRIVTPRGPLWTAWTGSAYHGNGGGVEGFIGVGRDISKRRELEQQLRQSQRLQAVGQLAGGIAHDFNNILQAVLGYIEFVMEDLPAESAIRGDLDQARVATERAAVLVRQLLAFSRRQILKPVNLNLNQVVADMKPMLERVLGSGIPIDFRAAADLGLVRADQGQLEQILMNLAVNARDAMESGGRIAITTANVEVDEEFRLRHQGKTAGSYVRLDFADTGEGMPPEVLEKVFEPFFTTKDARSGTGLGLATVYGIVKQHDGMILVDSQPGAGACFSIFLPVAEGVVTGVPAGTAPAPARGDETVLMAEDEPMLRRLGTRILENAGYRVLGGGDGLEAWEVYLAHEEEIDLALLDVVMPRLDGRGLAEKIRARRPDLPILFVSGYDSDSVSGRKPHLPGTGRVPKPYNRHELLSAVRHRLDQGHE